MVLSSLAGYMEDKTVVVTGGTRGIGEAVVHELAAAGAHVVTCSRDKADLDALATDVRDAGGTIAVMRADVRDEYDVEWLVETAAKESDGGIDAVIANAGVYHGPAGETPIDEEAYSAFDEHIRTNARGVFATFRESVPHLSEDARLLTLSGDVAREGKPGYGSYAVSKAAAEAVVRGFAADVEYTVAVVDPGYIATDLTGGRGRDSEVAAELVKWAVTADGIDEFDGEVVDLREMKTA
jgi:3-oxoacyl-[acyl-carrier protein] reductase